MGHWSQPRSCPSIPPQWEHLPRPTGTVDVFDVEDVVVVVDVVDVVAVVDVLDVADDVDVLEVVDFADVLDVIGVELGSIVNE